MRIPKKLFIHYKNFDESDFSLMFSNKTAICGSLSVVEGTDGMEWEDMIRNEESIVSANWEETDEKISFFLENGKKIVLQKKRQNWVSDSGLSTIEIQHGYLVNDFAHHFCKETNIEPVPHPYEELAHKRRELKNNFVINWFLGNTCSFSCSYCPTYLNDGSLPWGDFKLIKSFCDKVIHQAPKEKQIVFEFTGGEVTLWKDYAKLCHYLKSKDVIISMITNGSRSLRWWKENYTAFDVINMSYHTEFVKRDHFMDLCEFLKDKLDLIINVMVPPGKVEECLQLGGEIAYKKNILVFMKPLIEDLEGELLLGYSEKCLEQMNHFNDTLGVQFSHNKKWKNYRDNMVKRKANGECTEAFHVELVSARENTWYGWKCFSGVEQIAIDAQGNVFRGWCKVGGNIGHVADPNFQLTQNPVLCNKELCHCNYDMFSTKQKY